MLPRMQHCFCDDEKVQFVSCVTEGFIHSLWIYEVFFPGNTQPGGRYTLIKNVSLSGAL